MSDSTHSSLRSQMGPLFFLVGIFFLNFLARVILSPLMPIVEKDLKIGHDEAGSLFFLISLGYCVGLLASGFVSSRLSHRKTIFLSSIAVGLGLMIVSVSHNLWAIRSGLIFLGMAAGFYLPSGIATVTGLIRPEHWGKAIAFHELAPNLGFLIAPLLAEALLSFFLWRGVLLLIGIGSIVAGAVFIFWGKGGTFRGEAPDLKTLQSILGGSSFWILIVLFSLGTGASFGVYSMIPLYLVSEKGMERTWANTLLGLSRISALVIVLLSGWVTDRLGARRTLKAVFLANGLSTMILGTVSGSWIVIMLFVQPMIATCFFPAGFAALSRMGSPRIKNVAISVTASLGILLGGGAIPAGIGLIGELWSFSLGFILLGALLFVGVVLVQFLKLSNE
jgi:NNP family nitrate/nitrite transporter-like MFS transporter